VCDLFAIDKFLVSVLCRIDETVMLDMDILPKLNYVSMTCNDYSTSDSRSPADMTSVISAVNAAAIKYLDDQQLVQQAAAAAGKGRNISSQSARHPGQPAVSSSNASIYGIKSANLSLASKKYFEKHLLGTNRSHPRVTEPQSAKPREMSKSQMEDLLHSITSQVNGLQMTMSSRHSAQRNTLTDYSGHHLNNGVSVGRRQTGLSSGSSAGNERPQNLPTRQHGRKSFDGSASSNEIYSSKWHHSSHHRSSLDSSKQCRSHHGVQLCAIDRTLEFDESIVVDQ